MIINFPNSRAVRAGLVARSIPSAAVFMPKPERVPSPRRLICRWVVDPVGGALRANWHYPETRDSAAAGIDDPDRLRLAA
jgi:hypothetical protein